MSTRGIWRRRGDGFNAPTFELVGGSEPYFLGPRPSEQREQKRAPGDRLPFGAAIIIGSNFGEKSGHASEADPVHVLGTEARLQCIVETCRGIALCPPVRYGETEYLTDALLSPPAYLQGAASFDHAQSCKHIGRRDAADVGAAKCVKEIEIVSYRRGANDEKPSWPLTLSV